MFVPHVPNKEEILIYSAGKVGTGASLFRKMRDEHGFNINARWINWGPDREFNFDETDKNAVWRFCVYDSSVCDMYIVFCLTRQDDMRGVIMEAGHAMGRLKPIYCIGTCDRFTGDGSSDAAFTYHDLWHFTKATTLLEGYEEAVEHYRKNYYLQWNMTRMGLVQTMNDPAPLYPGIAA